LDRRLGKPSVRRVAEEWADRVEQLYLERYTGFACRPDVTGVVLALTIFRAAKLLTGVTP
jgi:hypothetical protein